MARKQRSEAEKATTEFTLKIESDAGLDGSIEDDVKHLLTRLRIRLRLADDREACCALRDYAQLLIARHMDLAAAGLDDDMKRLRAELEASK
jgi:hypothetical protein